MVIGGGTGVFTELSGLKHYFTDLSAIVAMTDDGGSTGILREEFGILPPGDIRRALVALAGNSDKTLAELFNYRFSEGSGLSGHSFGNLMLTALERITGSFEAAVAEAGRILQINGQVIPVTLQPARLFAKLQSGQVIQGETNIDIPKHDPTDRITDLWIEPVVPANPKAVTAIKSADLVILGPGDLFTSVVPNLLVGGVAESLRQTKAAVIYVSNLMTKRGETDRFKASDLLSTMNEYLGRGTIDAVLLNSRQPSSNRLKPYLKEESELVIDDLPNEPWVIRADLIRSQGFVRHDPSKLGLAIRELV